MHSYFLPLDVEEYVSDRRRFHGDKKLGSSSYVSSLIFSLVFFFIFFYSFFFLKGNLTNSLQKKKIKNHI